MLEIKSYRDVKIVGVETINHEVIRVEFKHENKCYNLKRINKTYYGEYALYDGTSEVARAVAGWNIEFGYLFDRNGVKDADVRDFVWALALMKLAKTEFDAEAENMQIRLDAVTKDLQVVNSVYQGIYRRPNK